MNKPSTPPHNRVETVMGRWPLCADAATKSQRAAWAWKSCASLLEPHLQLVESTRDKHHQDQCTNRGQDV